jgi:hypothetical protein
MTRNRPPGNKSKGAPGLALRPGIRATDLEWKPHSPCVIRSSRLAGGKLREKRTVCSLGAANSQWRVQRGNDPALCTGKKIGCPIQAVLWLEWDTAGPNRPLSLCHPDRSEDGRVAHPLGFYTFPVEGSSHFIGVAGSGWNGTGFVSGHDFSRAIND